jgi:predicted cupin superfamily sugar epimerase
VHPDARALVDALGLAPHPEGGFYRETFRAPLGVETARGRRAASTAIYHLLPAGAASARHRVASDEVWHHYAGDPLELVIEPAGGGREVILLGPDVAAGQHPQAVVPAGAWQAARPLGARFVLCGCTVAPGFDFADFELG